jgi:hypothetical protein
MRIIQTPTRRPGESGQAFIDRMLAELNTKGGATALPTPPKVEITANTAKVANEVRANAETNSPAGHVPGPADALADRSPAALGGTKHWPPLQGQRYTGAWPPAALRSKGPPYHPGVTLPLDEGQKAWLQRYAEKYPDACNPYSQVTLAEAKAREARQLTVSS